jgi:hypothetical protein
LEVKRPGREADHSPPSNDEVKERVELYLNSRNMPSWRGALLKHRDKFTFFTFIKWTFIIIIIIIFVLIFLWKTKQFSPLIWTQLQKNKTEHI